MKIQRIDHVGVIVNDLAAAKAFFLDLGLEVLGEWQVEGEQIVDRVIGLDNVKTAAAMIGVPGGQATIELVQFVTPADGAGIQQLPANTLGIRHIAFAVEDIEAVVAKLKEKGTQTFSEIQDFGQHKLCYIHGPEGIILELAEQIK
jgi:catechol 2,3-dioxygenase-like lactoylglutathione lyase family enzyme